jgi:hypothetical protein
MFAMFAMADESCFDADGRPKSDRSHLLTKLLADHKNVVSRVGAEVFEHRIHTLRALFDSVEIE